MRKRYSRSYTVLSFLTMFSYRELPSVSCFLLDYSVCVTLLFRFCIYACFALSRDLPKTKNR